MKRWCLCVYGEGKFLHSTKSPLSLQKVPPAKADNSILLWNIHSSGYSKNNSKSSPLAYPLHISDYPLSSASCFALLSNSSNLLSSSAPTRIQQYRLTAMTTAAPPIIIPIISIHLFRPSTKKQGVSKMTSTSETPNISFLFFLF